MTLTKMRYGQVLALSLLLWEALLRNALASGPCPIRISQIGPRELPLRGSASYLYRIENLRRCSRRTLDVSLQLGDGLEFRRGFPVPDSAEGASVVWKRRSIGPGEVILLEAGVRARASSERTVRNELCAKVRDFLDLEFCQSYSLRLKP